MLTLKSDSSILIVITLLELTSTPAIGGLKHGNRLKMIATAALALLSVSAKTLSVLKATHHPQPFCWCWELSKASIISYFLQHLPQWAHGSHWSQTASFNSRNHR